MELRSDDVKKLVMYGLIQTDLDEKPQRPMTLKEEKEILHRFSTKDFPDTLNLCIRKTHKEPGRLFSVSALEKFLHTLRLFVGGRILGNFDKTGEQSEVLYVKIEIQHLTKKQHEELTNED